MSRFLLLFTVAVLSLGLPAIGNAQACGDADGNGALNISDMVYMLNYLFEAGPPSPDFDIADFDSHQEWTVNDAAVILNCTFGGCDPSQFCPPTIPAWNPAVTSGYRIRHTSAFPAHLDHSVVNLALDAAGLTGFQLPLRILVDTIPAQIDSVQFPVNGSIFEGDPNFLVLPSTPGVFVLASLPIFSYPSGSTPLARVFVSAPIDTASRLIHLEFADYVPAQAPPGHDGPITPMIATWNVPVKPSFFGTCCLVPGDANGDGACTISDAIYLINYYFAGGPGPMQCPALGDANGSGTLNISDAVWIISYIFMGGPAPLCT